MHGLAVYVKERLPFARDLYLENPPDSYLCFGLALLHCVLLLFPLSVTFFAFTRGFDGISSIRDEVLLINPSVNVFVFAYFNVHHKDWLTYSGETHRPGELCYNFSNYPIFLITLHGCLTFLLGSLIVTLTVLLFWIYLFLLTLNFVLQWLSIHW